jgi:hypothetical protein
MHRRRRAREIEDAVHFEQDRLDDIVADEFEIAAANQMSDIGALAAEEVIEANYVVTIVEQALT